MQNSQTGLFRRIVDFDFARFFASRELPLLIRILNFISLLGFLPWLPFMFVSIFFFDAPGNEKKAFPVFIMILIYPVVSSISLFLGIKIYRKSKILSYALSFLSVILIAWIAFGIYHF